MNKTEKPGDSITSGPEQKPRVGKQVYTTPKLQVYGSVRELTRSNVATGAEGASGMARAGGGSDRRIKENIVPLDDHPLGIRLYLFDYKPGYRDTWGHGRQLGVIADEVERVMPEAVTVHPDGYKMVDYAMLGITRTRH